MLFMPRHIFIVIKDYMLFLKVLVILDGLVCIFCKVSYKYHKLIHVVLKFIAVLLDYTFERII